MSYQLVNAVKLPTGKIKHSVKVPGGPDETFRYAAVRFAIIGPDGGKPGYFLGAGEETDDGLYFAANGRGPIRIVSEHEQADFSLDALFSELTDAMTMHLAEEVYLNFKNDDFRMAFFNYLDIKNLRNLSAIQAPYSGSFAIRIGIVKSYDERGDLLVDKGSPLFSDLKGLSRADLGEVDAEKNWYRLNCLSYLLAALQKYPPVQPLRMSPSINQGGPGSWMG